MVFKENPTFQVTIWGSPVSGNLLILMMAAFMLCGRNVTPQELIVSYYITQGLTRIYKGHLNVGQVMGAIHRIEIILRLVRCWEIRLHPLSII